MRVRDWRRWWESRPRRERPRYIIPHGMTEKERDQWEKERQREYFATHRSARVARWTSWLGAVIAVAGFIVSLSLSRIQTYIGYAMMILGAIIVLISVQFVSFLNW